MTLTMNLRRALMISALIGSAGCTVYVRPAAPVGAVFIETEPPRVREEVVVVRPGPEHVWIEGYWGYRGREYVWVPGRWEVPPPGHREWVKARWVREPRGWFLIEGHWR